jgi:hypothetical protein
MTSIDEVMGGACENVSVVPDTVYVFFCWYTPLIYTNVKFSPNDAELNVNTVCDPVPVKF